MYHIVVEEHISKAELRLTDIADLLQADWIPLAEQLGVSDNEVTRIQSEYEYVSEQALVMLHLWVQKNENQATGNDLERALKQIGRDDVIASCMCNVKEVTDLAEKAVARVYLDASTLNDFVCFYSIHYNPPQCTTMCYK